MISLKQPHYKDSTCECKQKTGILKEFKKLLTIPSDQKFNAYLKELAVIFSITIHIFAKYTFASAVALENGVPMFQRIFKLNDSSWYEIVIIYFGPKTCSKECGRTFLMSHYTTMIRNFTFLIFHFPQWPFNTGAHSIIASIYLK